MAQNRGGSNFYGAAGIIAGATFLSRILGLVREQVFAYFFGAGLYTDAFQIAFRIPNLLRDLFAEGAMSSSLVPVYTKAKVQHGDEYSWRLVSNVITSLVLVLGSLSLVGILFADPLVALYAPGFGEIPGKHELTVSLTRILWPFLPVVVLAAIWMGVLNSRDRYATPALAPAVFNLSSILAAFLLCPLMEPLFGLHPIYGMAIGALLGGLGQWLIQAPALRKEGFRFSLHLNWKDPDLRRIVMLMGAGTFALAATQVNILVNSIMAASQGDGAVSWLNYAFRLMQFPIGVFGVAISTATLTRVSHQAAANDMLAVSKSVENSLRMVLALTVPSAVGLAVLGVPIIAVIYEHGLFKPEDTMATAGALACYALGLSAYSGIKVLVPVFYSIGRSRVAVISSGLSVALNVTLCILFVGRWGFKGLALATSCAAILNCGILLILLDRLINEVDFRSVARCAGATALSAVAMALVLWGILHFLGIPLWGKVPSDSLWSLARFPMRLFFLFGSLVTGVACYWGCAKVLGLNEVNRLTHLVLERIWKFRGQK